MFDATISTHSVENSKLAPDVYLYVCKCLGLEPDDCVEVEDAYSAPSPPTVWDVM